MQKIRDLFCAWCTEMQKREAKVKCEKGKGRKNEQVNYIYRSKTILDRSVKSDKKTRKRRGAEFLSNAFGKFNLPRKEKDTLSSEKTLIFA